MEILGFDILKDGGTIEIETDKGTFCYDRRSNTDTPFGLYYGHPKENGENLVPEPKLLDKKLINLLEEFAMNRFSVYYPNILELINHKKNV